MHTSTRLTIGATLALAAAACSEPPSSTAGSLEAARRPADPAVSVAFRDAPTDNIRSDGRFAGVYTNGQCGVSATFNLSDLRLALQSPLSGKDKAACGDPRTIALAFHDADGLPDGTSSFLNVDHVQDVTVEAGTVERHAQLTGTCNRVVFDPDEFAATSRVLVTRTGPSTWTVLAPDAAQAFCVGRGKLYVLPFQVTVQQLAGPSATQLDLITPTAIPSDIKIAFTRFGPGSIDVYGVREDGTGVINLTPDAGFDDQPAWSPDGSQLAFRSDRDGDREIYVMDAAEGAIRRLTFHPALDGEPAWSPDGAKIAFRRSESFGDFTREPCHPEPCSQPAPSEIWVMNADGSDAMSLTQHPEARDAHPSWSPDGSQIVFERTRVNSTRVDLIVMEADGKRERVITPWGGDPQALQAGIIRALDVEPSWSPDGTTIVFRALRDFFGYDIWTVNPESRELRQLIELPGPQITPAWSPDGTRIIFASGGLRVMNSDGSGLMVLTSEAIDAWPTWRR